MDHRALHLQPASHRAVARALATGKLARRPCEVCGGVGQAHHDSYFPERWLDVRWLCGKHHREWHDANEPEWPTIFDHHPSDADCRMNPGYRGKRPRPWWHGSRKVWYVTLGGRQHNLGPEPARAAELCERLLAAHRALLDAKKAAREAAR